MELDAAQREVAAALTWWTTREELGDQPITGYREQDGQLRVMVDWGTGGLKRYTHPTADLSRILNAYRSEHGLPGPERTGRPDQPGNRDGFPLRMELPEPVEYLVDLSYLDEILELHDPGADLRQYVGREPRTLEDHLRHGAQAEGDGG